MVSDVNLMVHDRPTYNGTKALLYSCTMVLSQHTGRRQGVSDITQRFIDRMIRDHAGVEEIRIGGALEQLRGRTNRLDLGESLLWFRVVNGRPDSLEQSGA